MNNSQLAFMTLVYAVVLYQASGMIAGGSEMLQLVPSIAGIVGSIVLPILGAVPDGMMVLFSGVGPNAQETVAVGIGALAGSTVMLLTFPWFICIACGRVPLKDGKPDWSNKEPPPLCGSGIAFAKTIKKNTKIMLATTVLYFVIQVPATWEESLGASDKEQGKREHQPAMVGIICCSVAFVLYLIASFVDANEDKQLLEVIKGIEKKQISIAAALSFIQSSSESDKEQALLETNTRLKKICRPFFKRYDYNGDGSLGVSELKPLLHDLGYYPNVQTVDELLRDQDANGDGEVSFDEFVKYLYNFMLDEKKMSNAPHFAPPHVRKAAEEEDDDEEMMPEDLVNLTPTQQLRKILIRATWWMSVGSVLILVFSDPMVDCLSEWGNRLNISSFYISFVLAPFASNASELLSAYTYAVKKTERNMTTALSTLVGAACMNNTFVLGIFFALIYVQGLCWKFTAETIAMVVIQWIIGLMAYTSKTQNMVKGVIILLCYPGCLFLVWSLKNWAGLD